MQGIVRQARALHEKLDVALSAIGVVEVTHGIYRAKTNAERQRRLIFSEAIFRDLVVHPVSLVFCLLPIFPHTAMLG